MVLTRLFLHLYFFRIGDRLTPPDFAGLVEFVPFANANDNLADK
jgi:hypothetical protein